MPHYSKITAIYISEMCSKTTVKVLEEVDKREIEEWPLRAQRSLSKIRAIVFAGALVAVG